MEINSRAKDSFSYQDYTAAGRIEGVEIVDVARFNDDGGAITELGRLTEGFHGQLEGFEVKQFNYSEVEPDAVKAYHLHHRQDRIIMQVWGGFAILPFLPSLGGSAFAQW